MSANREEMEVKIEEKLEEKVNLNGTGFIHYKRTVLMDLPYDGMLNGQIQLLEDEHNAALDKIVERASRYKIVIRSITAYASEPGDIDYNLDLSQRRADAVFDYIKRKVDEEPALDEKIYINAKIYAKGEKLIPQPMPDGSDHPLNRRVEIAYTLKYTYPIPAGENMARSRQWKIDFNASSTAGAKSFGAQAGIGTLTMLPDGENGVTESTTKNITFESFGLSVGIFSMLKKLSLIKKIPGVGRLIEGLDKLEIPGGTLANRITVELLANLGISADVSSEGGEFETQIAVTFDEMEELNFAILSMGVSVLGKGEGALILLHSGYFVSYTMLFSSGVEVAMPDASINLVPAGSIQILNN